MADPSPQIELPDWEYVELYNSSEFPINIKNWKLIIGSSEYLINEDVEIQADDYLILCNIDAAEDLSQYGNCYGFSSFQISNSGANLTLIDKNENYISSIDFDISWHSADYKKDGGWSLEQIDAHNPCAGKPNWNSSISKEGGTPGKSNSIKNENIIFPKLNYINPISNNIIDVYFNQNMNIETLQNIENYYIKEMQLHPEEVYLFPDKKGFVELIFNHDFEENKLYTLNINNVTNCKDIALEKDIKTATNDNSIYNRAAKPYINAKKLLTQSENYARFDEIAAMYDEAKLRHEQAQADAKAEADRIAAEEKAYGEKLKAEKAAKKNK